MAVVPVRATFFPEIAGACQTEASGSKPKEGTHRRREWKKWAIEVFLEGSDYSKKKPAMTRQDECPAIDDLPALLIEQEPPAMASALARLMNHAMQIE